MLRQHFQCWPSFPKKSVIHRLEQKVSYILWCVQMGPWPWMLSRLSMLRQSAVEALRECADAMTDMSKENPVANLQQINCFVSVACQAIRKARQRLSCNPIGLVFALRAFHLSSFNTPSFFTSYSMGSIRVIIQFPTPQACEVDMICECFRCDRQ
jgi:hypothetical protein